ncbi:UDP-4-amino-4-deoxy-L-arabinose--oxoglutarate aminotransferase [Lacipirellula limnantheis]|uniref:UDP-4-amino-4-deoxy-L-arabinose--oxoglutarate aminotransferase n=2 Tax=Lacipirellula limnantheis TaxID=2528024 RepID=A0A517TYJ0_9BACT|nr:UDP-4-amino-4-deoxy-L-arabinose--oxoglutarate aminotransferase [Lacipirellula limnantheis]
MSSTSATVSMSLPSDQDASGRTLGEAEISALSEAIRTGTLTSTKGAFVKQLENRFAEMLEAKFAYACSHGTAAIHCAIAAINPEPGDEIVSTSITDMGALTPILYQGAIPVFADVDPATCNVTAASIERVLSPRTKAVVVTHLFGNPCDMTPIMELCRSRGIPVIEDCAQAFLARHQGESVGMIGDIGCFSLQQGKHITAGEGGLVVTNNPDYARRMFLFINKAWGYGDAAPDHYFLALNYRMNELQGAVAVAQLDKLEDVVDRRIALADELTAAISEIPGIAAPEIQACDVHTYWKYCVHVDPAVIPGGTVALAAALKKRGIFSAPRYIQKPAFECEVFRDQRTFGESRWPFTLARAEAVAYRREDFPGTYQGLSTILVLPWNEKYASEHVQFIAESIAACAAELQGVAA